MKFTITSRIQIAGLALALLFISSAAFSATGVHLQLKGNGKSYTCTADATGAFSFSNVDPGTYKLVWVLPDSTESCSIDIQSFSWGTSSAGKSTQVTRSNISNNRTAVTSGDLAGSPDLSGTQVQGKSTPVTRSNISNNRSSGGSGKVSVSDFHFTKQASSYSRDGGSDVVIIADAITIDEMTTATGTITSYSYKATQGKSGSTR